MVIIIFWVSQKKKIFDSLVALFKINESIKLFKCFGLLYENIIIGELINLKNQLISYNIY